MSASTHGGTPYYYVPAESRHPVMAAAGLFFVILGAGQWINGHDWGKYSLALGLAWCCSRCTSGSAMRCVRVKVACMVTRSICRTAGA